MSTHDDLLRDSAMWKRSYDVGETNYANMLTARGVIGSFDDALRDEVARAETAEAELFAFKSSNNILVQAEAEARARAETAETALAAARDAGDALAEELRQWGWGDFHYGRQTEQEPSVVAALAKWDALLDVPDQLNPEMCPNCGEVHPPPYCRIGIPTKDRT